MEVFSSTNGQSFSMDQQCIVIDEGQVRVMQGFGKFLPMAPFAPHVYEKVRAKEAEARSTTAVIRSEVCCNNL